MNAYAKNGNVGKMSEMEIFSESDTRFLKEFESAN